MDVKKLIPWNWFKKEDEHAAGTVPVKRERPHGDGGDFGSSLQHFHREIDRLFDHAFRNFGLRPFEFEHSGMAHLADDIMLKPTLDLGATDKEYAITVEIPGVDEKDVKLEISDDILTISGEKKHEKEEKDKNYYRMERSYGSFQRVLSLPEDADQDGIKATFKNGVLTVTLPRKTLPKTETRRIEVKSV